MFSKISRYRHQSDVAAVDATGRVVQSKRLRLLPEVTGDFLHTIEEGDRLDHLAYKYYKQPRDWWRIADANPAFLSPRALLGTEARATVQIPLTWDGPAAPWSDLTRALRQTIGVESAVMGAPEWAYASQEIIQGALAFDINPALADALDASARLQDLTPVLAAALASESVTLSDDLRLEKPDPVTWHLTDRPTQQVYTFQLFEDEGGLNVYESTVRYEWIVTVVYNTRLVTVEALLDSVEALGFAPAPPVNVSRLGKSIVIPPRQEARS